MGRSVYKNYKIGESYDGFKINCSGIAVQFDGSELYITLEHYKVTDKHLNALMNGGFSIIGAVYDDFPTLYITFNDGLMYQSAIYIKYCDEISEIEDVPKTGYPVNLLISDSITGTLESFKTHKLSVEFSEWLKEVTTEFFDDLNNITSPSNSWFKKAAKMPPIMVIDKNKHRTASCKVIEYKFVKVTEDNVNTTLYKS